MSNIKPIYLFTGPEFGLRDDAVDEIRKIQKKQIGEIDEQNFYLIETPFAQVMSVLQSGNLFASGVCVVCKNAELLKKKEDLALISQWLEIADFSSILILISDEISVDSKLEKLIPKENKKIFWEMFDNKKQEWLTNYICKNGYKIKIAAVQLILDLVENNTQALKSECSRLFLCFPKGHEFSEKDIEEVLSSNREENVFDLFDVMMDETLSPPSRLEKALITLQKIRLSKENSSVMLLSGLSSCFTKIVNWHKIGEKSVFGATQQKIYRKASQVWTIGQATAILANIASADMEIRSNGSQMEDIVLQKVIYEIVIKKGSQLATLD